MIEREADCCFFARKNKRIEEDKGGRCKLFKHEAIAVWH